MRYLIMFVLFFTTFAFCNTTKVMDFHEILIKGEGNLKMPGLFEYVEIQKSKYNKNYNMGKFVNRPKNLLKNSLEVNF